jgi:putative PEP-CTERM system TPR-repeat lipoprotein
MIGRYFLKNIAGLTKFLRQMAVVSTLLVAACNSQDSPDSQLAKANDYFAKGKLNSATIELKNLLRDHPDNARARLLMGQINFEQRNLRDAESQLAKANDLGLDDALVLPLQSKVLLALRSYDKLRAISLENLKQEEQAVVLASQGLAEIRQGNESLGQIQIKEAYSIAPESLYVAVTMSRLLMIQTDPDYLLARSILEGVLATNPKEATAWSALAYLEEIQRLPEAAENAYIRAIESGSNNSGDMLRLALVRIQLNKYEQAQQDVDILLKLAPQSPGVYYAQGLIHLHTQNYKDSLTAFEIALWDEDGYPLAMLYSGVINLHEGNYAQAEAMAYRFLDKDINESAGRKLLAATRLKQGLYPEAEQALQPVVEAYPADLQALNLMASALAAQGKSSEYIDVMNQIVSLQPDSAAAQARLALGLLTEGARDSGLEHLETALELDPQFQQADVLTILNYLHEKNFSEAIKAASDYKRRNPGIAAPHVLAGRVYLEAGREQAAVDEFQEARKLEPGNPGACVSLASISLRNSDTATARIYFQEILENHENHMRTLLQLSALEGLEGNETLMVGYLQQAIKAHPGDAAPRLVMARYYLAHGKSLDASALLDEIGEDQKNTADVLEVTALTQMVQNNYPEARRTLEKLAKLSPESAKTHHQLAEVYAGLDLNEKAQAELKRAAELAPNDFYIRLANARWSLQAGDTTAFNNHLEALKAMQPKHPDVIELEYVAAKKNGNQERELELSQSLLSIAPGTKNMLRLAQRQWNSGDRQGSLETQEAWAREHPGDLACYLALAASYDLEKRFDDAARTYLKILEKDADNITALNNIAWLWRESKPEKALEYARKAKELRPESSAVIDTLAIVLLANGDVDEAKKTIAPVMRNEPNNPTYRYHSILIDAADGKRDTAVKDLEALLAETSNFREKAEATALLTQLKQ